MNRIIIKVIEELRQKKNYYIVVSLFLIVGILAGTYASQSMSSSDKEDLTNYFMNFINQSNSVNLDYKVLLQNISIKNLLFIIPIVIASFTFCGSPIILIIDFIKGFSIGYTFSFMSTLFSGNGRILALISVVPQNLVYVPCLISLSVLAVMIANARFKIRINKLSNIRIPKFSDNILKYFFLFICIFSTGIILETFISPSLIKVVLTRFYS